MPTHNYIIGPPINAPIIIIAPPLFITVSHFSVVNEKDFDLSVTTEGSLAPDSNYTLSCVFTKPGSIFAVPSVQWRKEDDFNRPIYADGCRVDVQYQTISQGRIVNVTFAPWRKYDGKGFVCRATISLQVPPYSLTLHSEVEAISDETSMRISVQLLNYN